MLVAFSAAGLWLVGGIPGYAITSAVDPSALPDPLGEDRVREAGAWLANLRRVIPGLIAAPVLAYAGALLAMLLAASGGPSGVRRLVAGDYRRHRHGGRLDVPLHDALVQRTPLQPDGVGQRVQPPDAGVMFWATMIFMPLIIIYTAWAYSVMSGKVTAAYIRANDHSAY